VGIEPALKPAAAASQTKTVGVMATRGTLQSEKFQALLASLHGQATFVLQPCDGLAIAIERNDATKIEALCAEYTGAMGQFGLNPEAMDTVVLGCTHYPFVEAVLRRSVGTQVAFLEGGAPVARQTRRLLEAAELLAPADATAPKPTTSFFTTGEVEDLRQATARWLHMEASVSALGV
jgi:glutamate racemase